MPVEDILFQDFAFHDLRSPLRISNWILEEVHHIQKALADQNTGHEYHLAKCFRGQEK